MKVQLVVVQGKPEGKVIPLAIPIFRIGRGETCHLRPNSDQVSREHAELALLSDKVTVRDLGSRNGTILNGKPVSGVATLKDGDLVQVGPLTFAVDIKGAPVAPAMPVASKPPSLDDVSNAEIDAWLVTDSAGVAPESPSGVYGGETMTIDSYKSLTPQPPPLGNAPKGSTPTPAPTPKPVEMSEEEADAADESIWKPDSDDHDAEGQVAEEFIDESNPFYAAKKAAAAAEQSSKAPPSADSSSAANDILRRMMERKRASK